MPTDEVTPERDERAPLAAGERASGSRLPVRAIALVTGALLAVAYAWSIGVFYLDDAFINLRYADHLAHGHGLVFNIGEEPVEGITALTWVLALAAVRFFGVGPETTLAAMTWLSAAVVLLLVGFADRVGGSALFGRPVGRGPAAEGADGRALAAISAWLLATSAPFLVWCQGGMDALFAAVVVTLLVLANAWVRTAREDGVVGHWPVVGLGVGAAFAYLTRPELVLVGFVLGALMLVRRRVVDAVWFAIGAAVPMTVHLIWRVVYYGDWLPNTARVKVGGLGAHADYGLVYAAAWLWSGWPLVLFAVAGAFTLGRRGRHELWLVPTVLLAFAVSVGGDHMPGFRFMAPFVPLIAWCAAHALLRCGPSLLALMVVGHVTAVTWFVLISLPGLPLEPVTAANVLLAVAVAPPVAFLLTSNGLRLLGTDLHRRGRRAVGVAAWIAVWSLLAMEYGGGRSDHYTVFATVNPRLRHFETIATPFAREAGAFLREDAARYGDDSVLAINAAGAVPYFAGLQTLDMLGLNDRHIAAREMPPGGAGPDEMFWPGHEKADGAYVFAQRPRYVIWGSSTGRVEPNFRSGLELAAIPEFTDWYELRTQVFEGLPYPLIYWVRVRDE